jgi:DNA-binding CsgD family transcriptional regulator
MHVISRRRRSRWRDVGWSHAGTHNKRLISSVALEALDRLCAGVIVTDNRGQVVEMNRSAKSIVLLGDGLLVRDGRVWASRVFETARVAKLIAGATAESKSGTAAGRMLIGRRDGATAYVLTVAPLGARVVADDRRLAMIVVIDPERHSPSERDLAELFGLSQAEARLATALLTGKRLSDVAANSGVQITTLRTQLGSVLRKVGAHRQSDLIRILSGTGVGSVSLSGAWFDIATAVMQMPQ